MALSMPFRWLFRLAISMSIFNHISVMLNSDTESGSESDSDFELPKKKLKAHHHARSKQGKSTLA
jgi:hypothetical protein